MTEWTLEPDEFAVHWYSDAVDRFPRPLHYLSLFQSEEEFANFRTATLLGCPGDDLTGIRRAIEVATSASWRIELSGSTCRTRDQTMAEYRIHATMNEFGAVIFDQIIRDGRDGPVTVHLVRPESLAQRVIRLLPALQPGGRSSEVYSTTRHRDSYLEDVAHNSDGDRYRRFIERPTTGGGSAALYLGTILDRPTPEMTTEWRDYTEDGRYTINRHPHETSVRPATPESQADEMSRWIDFATRRTQPVLNDFGRTVRW
ncbi:ESX secretion-associated protein EspG [Nocardia thailandica]